MALEHSDLKSHLWQCAEILRGSAVDRTDWKAYILPLLFFKRSCGDDFSSSVHLAGSCADGKKGRTRNATESLVGLALTAGSASAQIVTEMTPERIREAIAFALSERAVAEGGDLIGAGRQRRCGEAESGVRELRAEHRPDVGP